MGEGIKMYEIYFYSPVGYLLTAVTNWISLKYTLSVNKPTRLSLVLPYTEEMWSTLIKDIKVLVYRKGTLISDTSWFIRAFSREIDTDRREFIRIEADRANILLSQRIVEYPAGSAKASSQGKADDIMHSIVSENLGSSARDGRALPYFSAGTSASLGEECNKSFAKEVVQDILVDLANASASLGTRIYFDIEEVSSGFEFKTYIGQRGTDRTTGSATFIVGEDYNNISNASLSYSYIDMASVIYIGGQGSAEDRIMVSLSKDSVSGLTPYSRIERFFDGRNNSRVSDLIGKGLATLEKTRPQIRFKGELQDTENSRYGEDWEWGDKIKVNQFGLAFDAYINTVSINVSSQGEAIQSLVVGEDL